MTKPTREMLASWERNRRQERDRIIGDLAGELRNSQIRAWMRKFHAAQNAARGG